MSEQEHIANMEKFARGLSNGIENLAKEHFGKKMGFLLFFFEFGDLNTSSVYLSNGNREDCIKAMEELLEHLKSKGFTGTTEENN